MDTMVTLNVPNCEESNITDHMTQSCKNNRAVICPFLTEDQRDTLCRCSISDSCARVMLASFSRFSLNTSHFPAAIISFTASSVICRPDTSSCRIMKCLQRSCLVSRPSLYCRITCTCNYSKPEGK